MESAEKCKSSVSEAAFEHLLPDAIEVGRDSSLARSPGVVQDRMEAGGDGKMVLVLCSHVALAILVGRRSGTSSYGRLA